MTIDIAFIPDSHSSYELERYRNLKKYRFICINPCIKVGDIITSPDYKGRMIVTSVHPKDNGLFYLDMRLKVIVISTINTYKFQGETIKNSEEMDKRNISITLEQAREWYKSGNATLLKLALAVFTKEELEAYSYEQIMKEVSSSTTFSCITHPIIEEEAIKALNKLRNIAFYFNGRWNKNTTETGFFLSPRTWSSTEGTQKYGWAILKHVNIKYPGIIYFKSEDAAMKALEIAYTEGWLYNLK